MNEATQATGITSREFLDKLPKKTKEDHAKDSEEMKRLGEKYKKRLKLDYRIKWQLNRRYVALISHLHSAIYAPLRRHQ